MFACYVCKYYALAFCLCFALNLKKEKQNLQLNSYEYKQDSCKYSELVFAVLFT